MHEKKRRIRSELAAILNRRLEGTLMSAESLRPNCRKNLLASEPRYRPGKKSGNNAQNDSCHRGLLFFRVTRVIRFSAQDFILRVAFHLHAYFPTLAVSLLISRLMPDDVTAIDIREDSSVYLRRLLRTF